MTDVELLKRLLKGEFTCLHIGFNDHHSCNYTDAKGWYEEFGFYSGGEEDIISWVNEEERLKAIEYNSVWTIQWYPDTPVGFYCVGASTLEVAVNSALSYLKYGDEE